MHIGELDVAGSTGLALSRTLPGEHVGLVMGTAAHVRLAPGWEAPGEKMDCSEGRATGTAPQ